ncbi:hypothetical protein KQX54_006948 [Cotesia glomerata]|uniref:ADAMTS cysteine-rich domain-containing protein n=1 Tax=Cotesia glomerata TaxID=32391 RepID=A0AAV7HXZ6_COTGL|nr:hypothetical protein KQX54_006948 [Cotesia glomerata]
MLYQWSFFRNESSQCLRNKPDDFNYTIARFLPGKLMDADQQCQRNGATGFVNVTSICTMLQCYYPEKGCVKSNVPIADGTLCDPNAINDEEKEKIRTEITFFLGEEDEGGQDFCALRLLCLLNSLCPFLDSFSNPPAIPVVYFPFSQEEYVIRPLGLCTFRYGIEAELNVEGLLQKLPRIG